MVGFVVAIIERAILLSHISGTVSREGGEKKARLPNVLDCEDPLDLSSAGKRCPVLEILSLLSPYPFPTLGFFCFPPRNPSRDPI